MGLLWSSHRRTRSAGRALHRLSGGIPPGRIESPAGSYYARVRTKSAGGGSRGRALGSQDGASSSGLPPPLPARRPRRVYEDPDFLLPPTRVERRVARTAEFGPTETLSERIDAQLKQIASRRERQRARRQTAGRALRTVALVVSLVLAGGIAGVIIAAH